MQKCKKQEQRQDKRQEKGRARVALELRALRRRVRDQRPFLPRHEIAVSDRPVAVSHQLPSRAHHPRLADADIFSAGDDGEGGGCAGLELHDRDLVVHHVVVAVAEHAPTLRSAGEIRGSS